MAPPDRQGGGGLSLRTVVIASLASATAAMVTSSLFPPGAIFTAALTPVIVAAVSEMTRRPVDRISSLREQRRTAVLQPHPLSGAPDFALGDAADEELELESGNGHHADRDPLEGVEIHRRRPRILHPKVWLVTGLIAFTIAAAVMTLPELLFGGAVANNHRTTLFGGGTTTHKTETTKPETPATTTTEVPAQESPTQTETTPTTTTPTETGTTPTQTETAPADTGTGAVPVPGAPPQP